MKGEVNVITADRSKQMSRLVPDLATDPAKHPGIMGLVGRIAKLLQTAWHAPYKDHIEGFDVSETVGAALTYTIPRDELGVLECKYTRV